MFLLWIVVIVLVVFGLWLVVGYNSLIKGRNRTQEAWADIDVQLKRRYDLIPNLIETVKGYVKHERGTLEAVTKARTAAMNVHDKKNATPEQMAKSENMLSGALKTIFALSENYPDLKANTNFLQLQDELSDTENKIQASRRFYNGQTRDFNTAIQQFPKSVIAGWFHFVAFTFFEAEEKERKNVKVKF